jgi:hypothetical protein
LRKSLTGGGIILVGKSGTFTAQSEVLLDGFLSFGMIGIGMIGISIRYFKPN